MLQTVVNALNQIGMKRLAKGLVTVVALIALGYFAKSIDFEGWARWADFQHGSAWYQGMSGFVLAGAAFTVIGGPRQAVAFVAAYLFGLWTGFLLSMASVAISCITASGLARLFGASAREIVRGRVDFAFRVWRENPFSTTVILRLLPVGSNILTNVAAGAMGIPLIRFVAGSLIGYIPQMAVFSLMGTGVDVGAEWQIVLAILLFLVLTGFGLWVYGRYRKQLRSRQAGRAGADA